MKKTLIAISLFLFPIITFAATNFTSIIYKVGDWISLLTPIVVALALLYFFWGLAKFILMSGEEKAAGKDIMIYGIIALFVMVSVWGLVSILSNTFDVERGDTTEIPFVQVP